MELQPCGAELFIASRTPNRYRIVLAFGEARGKYQEPIMAADYHQHIIVEVR